MKDQKKFKEQLFNTFESLISDKEKHSSASFFSSWFKDKGKSYYFLFSKNLEITNVQFAELISLLQAHTSKENSDPIHDLQFISTNEFKEKIDGILSTFKLNKKNIKHVVELYSSLLRRTIVVDSYYGSCAVYLPPGLRSDLVSICAYSGYIHSCGHNIFLRRVEKAKKSELFSAIDRFLENQKSTKRKIFFTVYTHEDFDSYDRTAGDVLRKGLDDVKVYVEKYYIGSHRLVSVLQEMREKYKNQLEIPEPGNFQEKHIEFKKQAKDKIDSSRTLWLIVDRSIGSDPKAAGDEQYFVCYDQILRNKNPFFYFNEDKPAWIAHTTIPHTLMGGMINLSRPSWPNNNSVSLADPFNGTGTTLLETLKFNNVLISCSDLEPIAPLLSKDNLEFFSSDPSELSIFENQLNQISNLLKSSNKSSTEHGVNESEKLKSKYLWAVEIAKEFEATNAIDSHDIVQQLQKKDFAVRILFYLALRTRLRNIAAFARESKDWETAYIKETENLLHHIKRLKKLRSSELNNKLISLKGTPLDDISIPENITVFQGDYSISCLAPSFEKLKSVFKEISVNNIVRIADVRKLQERSHKVIITDPPYGYNTDDDALDLAQLYTDMLEVMIRSLENDGQLVICLPDQSHTGRGLSFFTNKKFVSHQVLSISKRLDREAITSNIIVPRPRSIFSPPYYWESKRALRRAILHFRIRDRRI